MTPEHKTMNEIRLECGRRNWIVVRVNVGKVRTADGGYFQSCDINGYPDLTILTDDGRVIFCEVKAGKGRLRPDQVAFHEELRKRGHTVITVWSVEEFKNAV